MDIKALADTPPWDWPEGTGKRFLDILRDPQSAPDDRLKATELAGDLTVVNDEMVETLLSILESDAAENLRSQAAISLGPVLEFADTEGLEDSDELDVTPPTVDRIHEVLHRSYLDGGVPQDVRRRILEASVRAPQDWHRDAIRAAYASGDDNWRLTAVFCMRFVSGFEEQILEELNSANPGIRYEAVLAAGNWELEAAWPQVASLITSTDTGKDLLLAAIEAVAWIHPESAAEVLDDLIDSDDEEISEAVEEALAMARGVADADDEDDDDDRDDDEDDEDDEK